MFNIGGGEILALLIIGIILIGPDRMPGIAADAAKLLNKIKNIAQGVTSDLKNNLGPGYENLQVSDLHPKTFIKKHLGEALDQSDLEVKVKPKIDPEIL